MLVKILEVECDGSELGLKLRSNRVRCDFCSRNIFFSESGCVQLHLKLRNSTEAEELAATMRVHVQASWSGTCFLIFDKVGTCLCFR